MVFNFQLYFTESHNGWVWKGPLELILSNPLLKQGYVGLASKDYVQMASE